MKTLTKLLAGALAALSCTAIIAAVPPDLIRANYSVFASDQNGDGCPDYLVKSPDAIVSIDLDDVLIPIPVPSKDLPFMLQSTTGCAYTLVQGLTRAQVTSSAWKKADYQVVVGDVKGDGGGSLLVSPTVSSSTPTFNVARTPTTKMFALLQALKSSDFQAGISGTTVTLEFADGDGRTDMVVRLGNQILGVYAAAADGKFTTTGDSNSIGAAHALWNALMVPMRANDTEGVLALISKSYQTDARSLLTSGGVDLSKFAAMVTKLDVFEVGDGYVRAALILTENGKRHMHTVLMGVDSDGAWKIFDM